MTILNRMPNLAHHRNLLAAAEDSLARARDNYRAAARRAGFSTEGLFADSIFVPRTTVDRWVARAECEAAERSQQVILLALKASQNPGSSPFAHLARPGAGREIADAIIAASKKARGED